MGDLLNENNLKHRLILSGLRELEKHGIKDFSLRRVASDAQVSCAAPYRHFKNKDQLICAILEYIKDDWFLITSQISQVFSNDNPTLIKELCASCVKFWIANGNFLSVLFLIQSTTDPTHKKVLKQFDTPIINAIKKLCREKGFSSEKSVLLEYAVCSLIYGSIMSITKEENDSQTVILNMKNTVQQLII